MMTSQVGEVWGTRHLAEMARAFYREGKTHGREVGVLHPLPDERKMPKHPLY